MVAGSNPSVFPVLEPFEEQPVSTEFRVDVYTPSYLSKDRARSRPANIILSKLQVSVQDEIDINFACSPTAATLKIALYHGGFNTYSLHTGQRMLYLDTVGFNAGSAEQKVTASIPGNSALTSPGPYAVFVVVDNVPGVVQFTSVISNATAAMAVPADETSSAQSFPPQPAGTIDLTTDSVTVNHGAGPVSCVTWECFTSE